MDDETARKIVERMEYLEGQSAALLQVVSMFIALHPHQAVFLGLFDTMKEDASSENVSPAYRRGVEASVENIHSFEVLMRAAAGIIQPASD